METVRVVLLVLTTITMGIVAGLFFGFSISVMIGLRGTDDRTFIDVMARINSAILNGWFMFCYVGSVLFGIAAIALHWGERAVLLPLVLAFGAYFISFMLTGRFNVPLNDMLDKTVKRGNITDPAGVRTRYEGPWTRWNHIRSVFNIAAVAFMCWSLLAAGSA
ncbi:DUF1772 domain-containing protein [Actinokineospora sp. PR83]|uniref:anthrone oxygenase family protein n=1 Tax=Actinokineospora sp. PR83 TaxID=2884908 RepID=UPI0027E1EF39|nr:anthrone oxygenase family protein [Actinokineospora sp. PR83]MCG8915185.1 DUF1772 domain-containing protein [Actinokineospora sp. PR83]